MHTGGLAAVAHYRYGCDREMVEFAGSIQALAGSIQRIT